MIGVNFCSGVDASTSIDLHPSIRCSFQYRNGAFFIHTLLCNHDHNTSQKDVSTLATLCWLDCERRFDSSATRGFILPSQVYGVFRGRSRALVLCARYRPVQLLLCCVLSPSYACVLLYCYALPTLLLCVFVVVSRPKNKMIVSMALFPSLLVDSRHHLHCVAVVCLRRTHYRIVEELHRKTSSLLFPVVRIRKYHTHPRRWKKSRLLRHIRCSWQCDQMPRHCWLFTVPVTGRREASTTPSVPSHPAILPLLRMPRSPFFFCCIVSSTRTSPAPSTSTAPSRPCFPFHWCFGPALSWAVALFLEDNEDDL